VATSKSNLSELDGLPSAGFVRLTGIIAPGGPLPISRSSWWNGVREGRYPQPVKLGPRITAWRCQDIRTLIQQWEA
jgi:prophage regulatory protein